MLRKRSNFTFRVATAAAYYLFMFFCLKSVRTTGLRQREQPPHDYRVNSTAVQHVTDQLGTPAPRRLSRVRGSLGGVWAEKKRRRSSGEASSYWVQRAGATGGGPASLYTCRPDDISWPVTQRPGRRDRNEHKCWRITEWGHHEELVWQRRPTNKDFKRQTTEMIIKLLWTRNPVGFIKKKDQRENYRFAPACRSGVKHFAIFKHAYSFLGFRCYAAYLAFKMFRFYVVFSYFYAIS